MVKRLKTGRAPFLVFFLWQIRFAQTIDMRRSGLGIEKSAALQAAKRAEPVVFVRPRSMPLPELTETKHLLMINNKGSNIAK